MKDYKELRKEIVAKTREYYQARFATKEFDAGMSRVNYAGRVFDADELSNAVEALL